MDVPKAMVREKLFSKRKIKEASIVELDSRDSALRTLAVLC